MRTISLTLLSGALCGCANAPISSPQLDGFICFWRITSISQFGPNSSVAPRH
jgi:hypothetical protein